MSGAGVVGVTPWVECNDLERFGLINIREIDPPARPRRCRADHFRCSHLDGDCIKASIHLASNDARTFGLAVQGTDELLNGREAQPFAGWPLACAVDEPPTMHVFVDRSAIEILAHGRGRTTIRTYHGPGDNLDQMRPIARGGATTVEPPRCLGHELM